MKSYVMSEMKSELLLQHVEKQIRNNTSKR